MSGSTLSQGSDRYHLLGNSSRNCLLGLHESRSRYSRLNRLCNVTCYVTYSGSNRFLDIRRVSSAQLSSRTLYNHCIVVLSDYLRGTRLKVWREFVGLVKLFHEYSIPLMYVAGIYKLLFVCVHVLHLFERCVAF